jgi:hypothetical protein
MQIPVIVSCLTLLINFNYKRVNISHKESRSTHGSYTIVILLLIHHLQSSVLETVSASIIRDISTLVMKAESFLNEDDCLLECYATCIENDMFQRYLLPPSAG